MDLIKNPNPLYLYLAGLSLSATAGLPLIATHATSVLTFTIEHHELLFELNGSYVVLSFCENGLEIVTGIDDE